VVYEQLLACVGHPRAATAPLIHEWITQARRGREQKGNGEDVHVWNARSGHQRVITLLPGGKLRFTETTDSRPDP
jgi:hypothetical protein